MTDGPRRNDGSRKHGAGHASFLGGCIVPSTCSSIGGFRTRLVPAAVETQHPTCRSVRPSARKRSEAN